MERKEDLEDILGTIDYKGVEDYFGEGYWESDAKYFTGAEVHIINTNLNALRDLSAIIEECEEEVNG